MANMRSTPLNLPGLLLLEPEVHGDKRGHFLEAYNRRDLASLGIKEDFVQDNESLSRRGVLRGLHFQRLHPQAKLVRVLAGRIWDVCVDLRASSPSFGRWEGVELSSESHNCLYLPRGLAHGFLALSGEALVAYKCSDYYAPGDEAGIRWDDPSLGIAWPDLGRPLLLSDRDRSLPVFDPEGFR